MSADFFASADLNDDNELAPLQFTLDTQIGPGPYASVMQNILTRHCHEIRSNAETTVYQPIHQVSRKKLKELLTKRNNELFAFLQRPGRTPYPNGIAETIFRRYGHDIPSLQRNHISIARDLNLDISMNDTIQEIDQALQRSGGKSTSDLISQLRWCFSQYRALGEEVLRLEGQLSQKVEILDKLHQRLPLITSLSNNTALPHLIDAFGGYLDEVFQASKIEDIYKDLINTYKKWNILKEIISLQQAVTDINTREPMCGICIEEPVSTAIVPCGHTFCTSCARKLNINCYLCRGVIREKVRLYFN
jgi:hypothetical protein